MYIQPDDAAFRHLGRALPGPRVAGDRESPPRGGPAAPHLEFPGARLVPACAVPSAPARRRRDPVRSLAAPSNGPVKEKDENDVEERRRAAASRNGVEVKRRAIELGFDAVGIATLERNPNAAALDRWLAAGYGSTMTYLHRQAERRKDPGRIMPGARVAVVTLTNYCHGTAPASGAARRDRARVAQYAWSGDYHRVLGARLARLAHAIVDAAPGARTRCYVDAGPVPERDLAQRAGLGWIGKNTMLIDPRRGSFTFIGVVLTDADLAPDLPFEADRCGTCRRCLDACPTEAFVAPRV